VKIKNLNLENDVQKMLKSMKTCRTYLHRLNFPKKMHRLKRAQSQVRSGLRNYRAGPDNHILLFVRVYCNVLIPVLNIATSPLNYGMLYENAW
jgi:hypothetical protein